VDIDELAHRTVNLFVVLDVHRPWRKVKLTARRMAEDYAQCTSEAKSTELKRIFLELASRYRELAELIDDPEQWRAKLFASHTAKQK
jgi:hypothetical protein